MRRLRASHDGAAALFCVAVLALVVLSVLVFSQAYTETSTLLVARSMAARTAGLAADSALAETFAKFAAGVNTKGSPFYEGLRKAPPAAGFQTSIEPAVTRQGLQRDVTVEPVGVSVTRVKLYTQPIDLQLPENRFGLIVLTARARARVAGTNQFTQVQATQVHELRQSPAIPPEIFYRLPLTIQSFPYVELKADEYQSALEGLKSQEDDISRRCVAELANQVAQMKATQAVIKAYSPETTGPPCSQTKEVQEARIKEITGSDPDSRIWGGIGVPSGTFPFKEPEWPSFPNPPEEAHANNPVYFQQEDKASPLPHADLVLTLPAAPDLTAIPNPFGQLPKNVYGEVDAALFDWPGSAAGLCNPADGKIYYPKGSSSAGFNLVIDPYKKYREEVNTKLAEQREAYAKVIDPYNKRLHFFTDKGPDSIRTFSDQYWPAVTIEFTRLRSAWVYPDKAAFDEAHGKESFRTYGIEFVDGDSILELTGEVKGTGTIAARNTIRAGPLMAEEPFTLVAGTRITLIGNVKASLVCPGGKVDFGSAQVTGAVAVQTLEPEDGTGSGSQINIDPKLVQMDLQRGDGVVVNIAPAAAVLLVQRGS